MGHLESKERLHISHTYFVSSRQFAHLQISFTPYFNQARRMFQCRLSQFFRKTYSVYSYYDIACMKKQLLNIDWKTVKTKRWRNRIFIAKCNPIGGEI